MGTRDVLKLKLPMTFDCFRRIVARLAMSGVLSFSTLIAVGQSNGIFADFSTSMGSFTCQLDYVNAPRTTANFIGLATGQRAWLDMPTGRARTKAFYNGLTFHRVIAGFMCQGGSPNGQGTDDPGYVFMDEFSPNLVFDGFGVLAMANSGPNSDGAQFFITVGPFITGNNVYSVFGRLTAGSNVVYAINHVATNANDKPLTNVVIQQVSIRRVGTAAQAFNIDAQGLPIVANLPLKIAAAGSQVTLSFTNRQYADNRLYSTTNLTGAWTSDALGIEITASVSISVPRAQDAPRRFYAMAQIQYASSTFAPNTMYGRTVTLNFTNGLSGTLVISFDSAGGGSYTFPPYAPGSVTSYSWTQDPYRGFLWPIYFSGLVPLTARLDFTSNTTGTFSGTFYPTISFAVSGTFSLSGT
jgi:peptidyl-prolyl cis-trans isomerase A (cyclophilin A)